LEFSGEAGIGIMSPDFRATKPVMLSRILGKNLELRGIPHLAKNERDMGYPALVAKKSLSYNPSR
jgi:hypothetical protein